MSNKKLPPAGKGKGGTRSRREFVKTVGAALTGAAVGGSLPGTTRARDPSDSHFVLDTDKITALSGNLKARDDFVAATDHIIEDMLSDSDFANLLLESTDSIKLINSFNSHRRTLEPLVGKVDGRSKAGRYKKMIVAAELCSGAGGLDSAGYTQGSEEFSLVHQTASSCSGCDRDDWAVLGCCIVHFWGWTYGGSCGSCSGDEEEPDPNPEIKPA